MLITYEMNDYEARVIPVDSRQELLEILRRNYDSHILTEDSECASQYRIISYQLPGSMRKFGVGISFTSFGIIPRIATVPYRNQALLGYNFTLLLIDIEREHTVFIQRFGTLIVFFKCYPGNILVLTEDCIYLLSYLGKVQKIHRLHDMLDQFEISSDALIFNTVSSPEKRTILLSDFGISSST